MWTATANIFIDVCYWPVVPNALWDSDETNKSANIVTGTDLRILSSLETVACCCSRLSGKQKKFHFN